MEDKANSENTEVEAVETATAPAKKPVKSSKPKSPREKASHPPTSEMVNAAIKELKDRKGSSLQAIKKYVAATYKVDGEKLAPFIKKYLKAAVTSGAVVQTKGKGASGSFKLAPSKTSDDTKGKKVAKPGKKVPATKPQPGEKKTVSKKADSKKAAPKKTPTEKKVAPKKAAAKASPKPKTATEAKNMSKTKKTAKAPAAKTKPPKPKKAATPKATKAAAKK